MLLILKIVLSPGLIEILDKLWIIVTTKCTVVM